MVGINYVSIDDIEKYDNLNAFYVEEINRLVELFKKRGILCVITSSHLYTKLPLFIDEYKNLSERVSKKYYTQKLLDDLIDYSERFNSIQEELHDMLRANY